MAVIVKMEHVTKQFGGLTAVNDFCGEIEEGSIVGLIGPNGAGKTTLFNMIANYYHPTSGRIYFKDKDITAAKTEDMAKMGLARTFQVTKPFGDMSVLQNIMVGGFLHINKAAKVEEKARRTAALVGMDCDLDMKAASTTTVDKKKLEIARALAVEPKLILLDEVMAGCNPQEKLELVETCRKVRDAGVTIIIIEHDIKTIMSLCDKIYILHRGEKLVEGTPEEVANDKRAVSAYLGEDFDNAEN
ncbi:MAG: ABC transporter ATP-binding protein [Lachnospiraceae bacterium]|nr:ABC transporter ATP-binding protein [Lachnospiraceae bacterium]